MDQLLKTTSALKAKIEVAGFELRGLKNQCQKVLPSAGQRESLSEAIANLTLALRHLEDAEDRLRRGDALLRHMDAIAKAEAAVSGGDGT